MTNEFGQPVNQPGFSNLIITWISTINLNSQLIQLTIFWSLSSDETIRLLKLSSQLSYLDQHQPPMLPNFDDTTMRRTWLKSWFWSLFCRFRHYFDAILNSMLVKDIHVSFNMFLNSISCNLIESNSSPKMNFNKNFQLKIALSKI